MAFFKVATLEEVPPGTVTEVVSGDHVLAVCNVEGEIRATSGICPHAYGPLGQGTLHGDLLTCPWHMWQFDTRTGECPFNPDVRVPVYKIQNEANSIFVDLPDA